MTAEVYTPAEESAAKPGVLVFDEGEHRYFMNGAEVRSVTGVLRDAGLVDYSYCTEFARWRGSVVHKAIQLELAGNLDWSTLSEEFQPFVNAALEMVRDLRGEIVEVERRVYSKLFGYAGTLDLILRVTEKLILIDHKTGPAIPATGLQLAGYEEAYCAETDAHISQRYACQLHADGTYSLHEFKNRTDRGRFLAAVTVVNARKEFGLL
jgi:hypothetical protein